MIGSCDHAQRVALGRRAFRKKSHAVAFLQRRSAQAAEFFRMPYKGVIVLNTAVEI